MFLQKTSKEYIPESCLNDPILNSTSFFEQPIVKDNIEKHSPKDIEMPNK